MKIELDVTKFVEKTVMRMKEDQEDFIFESILPYCEDILQININKEKLKQILLNGAQNQQPSDDYVSKKFVDIVIEYPTICPYKDYEGKPYYSIKYIENEQEYVGFGTYNIEVLSEYIRGYFIPSVPKKEKECDDE